MPWKQRDSGVDLRQRMLFGHVKICMVTNDPPYNGKGLIIGLDYIDQGLEGRLIYFFISAAPTEITEAQEKGERYEKIKKGSGKNVVHSYPVFSLKVDRTAEAISSSSS